FEPDQRDLTYSIYRPDLAAVGAVDGRMASRLPHSNNDALSRRDMGLEFLDVTSRVDVALIDSDDGSDSDDESRSDTEREARREERLSGSPGVPGYPHEEVGDEDEFRTGDCRRGACGRTRRDSCLDCFPLAGPPRPGRPRAGAGPGRAHLAQAHHRLLRLPD